CALPICATSATLAVLEFFASASVALVALYFGLGYLGMLPVDVAPDLGTGLFCLLLAPEFFAPMRRLGAHYHDRAAALAAAAGIESVLGLDRKSTRLNSSHVKIS